MFLVSAGLLDRVRCNKECEDQTVFGFMIRVPPVILDKAKCISSAVRENDIIVMEDCGFCKIEASREEIMCG